MRTSFFLALGRQRKILLLFLLTILVPSIVLGILGLRALEADQYRMEQLLRREQREALRSIRINWAREFEAVESSLRELTSASSLANPDWQQIHAAVYDMVRAGKISRPIIVIGPREEFFFAAEGYLVLPAGDRYAEPARPALFNEAYRYESARRHSEAASRYLKLAAAKDMPTRLSALNGLGRCYIKTGGYQEAAAAYRSILEAWPRVQDSEIALLPLIAGIQIDYSLEKIGRPDSALPFLFLAYRNLLRDRWIVDCERVRFYAGEYEARIERLCSDQQADPLCADFRDLRKLKQDRLEQVRELQDLLIPLRSLVLTRRESLPPGRTRMFRIPDSKYLAAASRVDSDRSPEDTTAIVAVIEERSLLNRITSLEPTQAASVGISVRDSRGETIVQTASPLKTQSVLEESLADGLWMVAAFHVTEASLQSLFSTRRSLYLAVTLLLAAVLFLGGFLTTRTVLHEMSLIRMKSDFVALVSHEFKSPITSIRTLMERLQSGSVTDTVKMKQYFDVVCADLQRLTRLVNNVLHFSKIESGQKTYHFAETNLTGLLSELLSVFEVRAVQKGFTIETDMAPDLPNVTVDADGITEAVLNLLDNTMKYSRDDKRIRITAACDTRFVRVDVRDFGAGIRREELDRIFEQSYRSADVARVPGVGLGLSIVRHVMEAHGGRVSVESEPGRGSTFSLWIPLVNALRAKDPDRGKRG